MDNIGFYRVNLQTSLIAIVVLGLLAYSYFYHTDMIRTTTGLIETAERVKQEIATAHIVLDEVVDGHRHKDAMTDVWQHMDRAERYLQAILHGDSNLVEDEEINAVDDVELQQNFQEIREQLTILREITGKRFEASIEQTNWTYIEQEYESQFKLFLEIADKTEKDVHKYLERRMFIYNIVQGVLALFIILLFLMAALILNRNRQHLLDHANSLEKEITERKQIEKELRNYDDKLSRILDTSPDSILISRLGDGKILYINPGFTRLLKYSKEEAIGKTITELDLWISKKDRRYLIKKLDEEGKVSDFESEFHTRDNKVVPGSVSASYIHMDGEKCVISVLHDITRRKQIIQRINRSYHEQQVLAEIMRLSLQELPIDELLDRSLDLILTSPSFFMLKEGAIFVTCDDGNTLKLVAHHNLSKPLQSSCAMVPFGKCLCGRAALNHDIVFTDHVSELHEIGFEGMKPHGHYCVPILLNERVLGVLNIYVDAGYVRKPDDEHFLRAVCQTMALAIEHKRTVQALTKSERQLSKIFNSTPDSVIISRLHDGKLLYVNPAFTNMFKFSQQEAIGETVHALSLWEKPEQRAKLVKDIEQAGEVSGFETRFRSKDGNILPVFISACKIDMEGEICLVTTTRDITEYKLLEERYQFTQFSVEQVADALFWIRPDAHFFYVNEAACKSLGYTHDELMSMTVMDIEAELTQEQWEQAWKELSREKSIKLESTHKRKDGTTFPVEVKANFLEYNGKEYDFAFVHDITERRQAEDAIQASYQSMAAILDGIDSLVYISDMDNYKVLFINEYGKKIFADATGKVCWQEFQENQAGPCGFCTNEQLLTKDGIPTGIHVWEFQNTQNKRWYECRDQAIKWFDGRMVRMEIATDITERKEGEEIIKYMAHHDQLTGLPNRALFMDRLEQAIARCRRDDSRLAIMFIDLDNFKPINDMLGHVVGDQILKQIADKLAGCMRQTDTLARFGGDEFVALITDLKTRDTPKQMAEKLNTVISGPIAIEKNEFKMGASIGISIYPEHADTPDQLLLLADKAMYEAKNSKSICKYAKASN